TLAGALVLTATGCDPVQLTVKEPIVERVLLVPDQSPRARRDETFGLQEVRDVEPGPRAAPPRALTADTDPARIERGTLSDQGAGTFACTIPGIASGWCAKAAGGPFVVTDVRTSAACGEQVLVAALTGQMTDGSRWTMRGPLDLHGARLLLRGDEWLF